MKMRGIKWIAAAVLIVCLGAVGVFLSGGYEASPEAITAMDTGRNSGHAQVFMPEEVRGGLIFYPGGLVDHRAYAPLMQELCERGVLCLLVQMPLDLAVLDMNAADGLQEMHPETERWLIGGHSLGGAMAASYAGEHADAYEGLVLLGAYSTTDLRESGLSVLSVYGSEDGVLNREKYDECLKHYPQDFEELVIDGGCHAYFGDYGVQKGDGAPTISMEEQIQITADSIAAMYDLDSE